ncbi:MAG: lyase [Candidatus Tectomicrobia bacterium]|uniref:Lyase n=1 Tax=Tectimicrobiota bacterium TaxID=2528274 RepID=A0A932GP15_UNCTE|nr:lyase [Candidatus Tectomicrobia bacterium]
MMPTINQHIVNSRLSVPSIEEERKIYPSVLSARMGKLMISVYRKVGTVLSFLVLILSVSPLPQTAAFQVREFPISISVSYPRDPAPSADGAVYFVAMNSDLVVRMDPTTKSFRSYNLPEGSQPHGIVADRDGNLWITAMGGNRISRLNPKTGDLSSYPIPSPGNGPHTPVLDPQDNLWFTMQRSGKIGKVERRTGKVTEYPIPTRGSGPYGIAVDQGGTVWFAELSGHKVGRLDPATGKITEYAPPTRRSGPRRVAIGPDGTVWFTQYRRGGLGKLDPATGKITEYPPVSGPDSGPYAIAVDGQGRIVYNEISANTVIRFDPRTERFETLALPSANTAIRKMAADAGGRVWFVGSSSKTIGWLE